MASSGSELGVTLQLPELVRSAGRSRDVAASFSGRNLHVWTKFEGIDPESGYGNGDVQNDFSTTSPPTYFTVRLNLHY